MSTDQQNIPGKERQPSCKAKPQIGLYIFAVILLVAFVITYLLMK